SAVQHETLRFFATCTGRLSALMEHQWLMDGPASDHTKAQREALIEIIDAILPPDLGPQVLTWRIEAKMAHAVLLTRATFGENPKDTAYARKLATRHVAECNAALLS
ncbi:MAG: hypothetical protein AAFR45_12435, partial [Pseudomonadota bacterium]